jgi:hypothetical protein
LRSYLDADDPLKPLELGAERHPDEYVGKLVAVLREVKRVLREDGLVFCNIGDTMIGYHGNSRVPDDKAPSNKPGYVENMRQSSAGKGIPNKSLAGAGAAGGWLGDSQQNRLV